MAKISLVHAEWALRGKKEAKREINFGLAMTDKILSMNSGSAETLAVRGTFYLLKALSEKDLALRLEAAHKGSGVARKITSNKFIAENGIPTQPRTRSRSSIELVESFLH